MWKLGDHCGLSWSKVDYDSPAQPRHPKGSPQGGEFAPKGGGGTGSGSGMPGEAALLEYQNWGYSRLNEQLRTGDLDAAAEERIAAIDSLFDDAKAKEVVVFRGDGAGLSAELFEEADLSPDFKVELEDLFKDGPYGRDVGRTLTEKLRGREFIDKAYLSTSKNRKVVDDGFVPGTFTINKFGGSGRVTIFGKTKSLDVDSITGMRAGESERLLPRGLRMRVNSVNVLPHADGKRVFLDWQVSIVQ